MRSYPAGVVFAAAVFAGHWFVLLPTSACIDGHRPVHRRRLVYDHSTGLVEGYCMDVLKIKRSVVPTVASYARVQDVPYRQTGQHYYVDLDDIGRIGESAKVDQAKKNKRKP